MFVPGDRVKFPLWELDNTEVLVKIKEIALIKKKKGPEPCVSRHIIIISIGSNAFFHFSFSSIYCALQ